MHEFGIPRRALETVGYGEEFLLVPTQNENWRNRRVTLRRFDDFIDASLTDSGANRTRESPA